MPALALAMIADVAVQDVAPTGVISLSPAAAQGVYLLVVVDQG